MTSLALVPYTFSFLKLPFVALQNVADYLNPFEIYQLSRTSKRTKKLAKALSKKAWRITFSPPFHVSIEFEWNRRWSFAPNVKPGPDSYTIDGQYIRIYGYFSKKPASEVFRVLERVVDLFKNSNFYLKFSTKYSSHEDLVSYFNWFMEDPSEVSSVYMACNSAKDVNFFIDNYKKPSVELHLLLLPSKEKLEIPENLKTTCFKEVDIIGSEPANLKLYNVFSSSVLGFFDAKLTNQDLNTLLKNWQFGLTNPHWRSVCIKMLEPIELKDVLKDITVTYRDPRTVKRNVSVDKESFWIFGGIDIENHHGSATATIQWKKYKVEKEDSEVPNHFIEEYERNQESGQIENHEQEGYPELSMIVW